MPMISSGTTFKHHHHQRDQPAFGQTAGADERQDRHQPRRDEHLGEAVCYQAGINSAK